MSAVTASCMASTLYAARNEPDWGERKVYMRKNPNPNPSPAVAAETTTSSSNPNPRPHAGPEDCTSFVHRGRHRGETLAGSYVTFNITAYSRSELRDLKKRLVSELDRVRGLASWIESRHLGPATRSASGSSGGGHPERDATSSSAPPEPPRQIKPEFTKSSGSKRPPPPATLLPRDAKRPAGYEPSAGITPLMKKCGQILTKLMKHKHGWVFNQPVDAIAMGLHDYNVIVKRPMDLGTVKSRLDASVYGTPLEFAADVRLTFNNALLYNPKGHDVYIMAEQLLRLFEDLYGPAREKYEKHKRAIAKEQEVERQWVQTAVAEPSNRLQPHPTVPATRMLPAAPVPSKRELSPVKQELPAAQRPVATPMPVTPHPQQIAVPVAKPAVVKQPKPKARDPNKREMSFKEKQKLSQDLQMIPDEKMDQVVQIVRKRNPDPALDGNEIELDFEALDTETLWELDRFVNNCKKMINKIRRQEAISASTTIAPPVPKNEEKVPVATVGETTPEVTPVKKNRRPEAGDEDVDIGDEMPSTHFPPVEIEKDNSSSSESSSSEDSSSSSSSDSDSRSSSGSDSDGDEAQSPAVGLRPPLLRT